MHEIATFAGEMEPVGKAHGVPNWKVVVYDPPDFFFKQFVSMVHVEQFAAENRLRIILEKEE